MFKRVQTLSPAEVSRQKTGTKSVGLTSHSCLFPLKWGYAEGEVCETGALGSSWSLIHPQGQAFLGNAPYEASLYPSFSPKGLLLDEIFSLGYSFGTQNPANRFK